MRLRELVEVVATEQGDTPDHILANLAVIHGAQTFGKATPGWVWYDRARVARLTPELETDDRFMRLQCIGHYPVFCLFVSDSLQDLEREILESHFSPFTSYTCAFIDGNLRRFDCYYRDLQGAEHVLDKQSQFGINAFDAHYGERRLRWL
jgi:hypothetical protein